MRELQHCVERVTLLADNDTINAKQLNLHCTAAPETTTSENFDGLTLADMEYQMLEQALIKHLRKPDEAANALGISRSAFYRKLAKYGFDLS